MSRPTPEPTPDQVAAMQRAKGNQSFRFRRWVDPADVAPKNRDDADRIIPRRERLVRA